MKGFITIDNLEAETEYKLFIYLKDRGGNVMENPSQLDYKTQPRFNAGLMKITFQQNYLNSAEKVVILDKLAFLMSLEQQNVRESEFVFMKNTGQTIDKTYDLFVDVIAVPTSKVYPSPVKLIEKFISKKALLKQSFQTFADTFPLYYEEFQRYDVNFSSEPFINKFTNSTVQVVMKLDNYGWGYAVALKNSENLGKPSPYQIQRGLNERNQRKSFQAIKIDQKFKEFQLLIKDLEQNTDYKLYVSAGSAHPGFPDMMSDQMTVILSFKTLTTPETPKLSLEWEGLRHVSLLLVLLW